MVANIHPDRDRTENVKLFKKRHGFEKFRKEIREKISYYFEGIIREKDEVLNQQKVDFDRERDKCKDLKN